MKILRVGDVQDQAPGIGKMPEPGFVIYGESGLPLVALNFETREAAADARRRIADILMTCTSFTKIP